MFAELQLLWWNAKVCKILLVNKILLVANKKSFFHRKIKICGKKFCSAVQSGPASDLPSKSFTWKDINSNSIAIQTSPSLKGWRDEWRLVQTMPLHRAERTWECTWRVNTVSKCTVHSVISTRLRFAVLRPSRSCLVNSLCSKSTLSSCRIYLCAVKDIYNVFRCVFSFALNTVSNLTDWRFSTGLSCI